MNWTTGVLLAAAASSDCFIIGFNYGVKGVRVSRTSNGFIALVCLLGTLGATLLGRCVGVFFPAGVGELIGGGLLTVLGLWVLVSAALPRRESARPYSEDPDMVDVDRSKVIELRESLLIGLMLCLNNLGIGVGAGLSGVSALYLPPLCGALSYLFLWAGSTLGACVVDRRLSKALEIASGLLILCFGLHSLADGLAAFPPFYG